MKWGRAVTAMRLPTVVSVASASVAAAVSADAILHKDLSCPLRAQNWSWMKQHVHFAMQGYPVPMLEPDAGLTCDLGVEEKLNFP